MKSLKIWSLVALLAMALVGCGKDNDDQGGNNPKPNEQADIVGKWHLISWCGAAPEFDVYVEFTNGGKFNIYQQTWTFTYQYFTGSYIIENGILMGVYSNGADWIANYRYEVANSKLLILKNKVNPNEVSIYEPSVVPSWIVEEATTSTRSEDVVPFL